MTGVGSEPGTVLKEDREVRTMDGAISGDQGKRTKEWFRL